MRSALRYLLTIVLGGAIGILAAVQTVRAGAFASDVTIGPWQTGRDFGSTDASPRTRAVVALRGLLALPAHEARYYTAATDDAGQPLDGRCRYRVTGGKLPGQWWSLTLYDRQGYLAGPGPYSIESAAVREPVWRIEVAPNREPGHWLPTGGLDRFDLTLRLYLPNDGGRGDPPRAVLPSITKAGC